MFQRYFKQKNYDDTLVVIGGTVVIAVVVHYFSELIDYMMAQPWFRFDPVLAIGLLFMAFRYNRSLQQQNTIITQQMAIIDRMDRRLKK